MEYGYSFFEICMKETVKLYDIKLKNIASAVRVAQHGNKQQFEKFIK